MTNPTSSASHPFPDSVTISQLANGMTIATDTMPGSESVTLGIWAAVGARDEGQAENGVAHLFEHMVFKGTPRRSARAIAEAIEDVGGHLNAWTSREQTAFHAKVLKADAALAVDVISDMLQHALMDEEELTREKSVVIQEIGQSQDTPDDCVFDHFQQTAFPDHYLGRPVLGTVDSVSSLQRQDLQGWFGHHYHPSRLMAVAAGAISHEAFRSEIEKHYQNNDKIGVAAQNGATPGTDRAMAPQFPPRKSAKYHPGLILDRRDSLEQVHVIVGFPGYDVTHPDYYAFNLYSTVLGGGMSSRLFQTIREEMGLAYSIYSFGASYQDIGLFGVYAGTSMETFEQYITALRDGIHSMTDHRALNANGGAAELERARAQMRAGLLMGRESTGTRAEGLAHQIMCLRRPLAVSEMVERINAVTAADIQRVAVKMASATPCIALVGPEVPANAVKILEDMVGSEVSIIQ
ncbi:MAG: pitrilysin family protein [Alphaproteobacteria bacterium]|nr:pitrilysin family protein [Alphaproteobacteria bacterium]